MDSILPEYLEKLKCSGSKIIYTVDNNETDFTKGIKELGQYANDNKINVGFIFIFGFSNLTFHYLLYILILYISSWMESLY